MSNKLAGYLVSLIVILGAIVGVVRAFDALEQRVSVLEIKDSFIHGSYAVPKGCK